MPPEELATQSEEPPLDEAAEETADSMVKLSSKKSTSNRGSASKSLIASNTQKSQVCHTTQIKSII